MRPSGPDFSVEVRRFEATVVLAPTGELDLSTAEQLRRALRDHEGQVSNLHLDLRGLTFMDAAGIEVIVDERRRARLGGFNFEVIHGNARVRRLFFLAGLAGLDSESLG